MTEQLAVATVQRSHGLKGYVRLKPFSGETGHIGSLREVWLKRGSRTTCYQVEDVRTGGNRPLMKLKGVDSPEAAAELIGAELWVDRRFAAPLEGDEYYVADLHGCRVIGESGVIGSVRSVFDSGAGDMLEIELTAGRTAIVPFRKEFVLSVDTEARQITVREDRVID